MDIDKGFKRTGIIKSQNQKQRFLPLTIQMSKEEVVAWAANTRKAWLASGKTAWFNPLILEHNYSSRSTLYSIVRPTASGWRINDGKECLFEIR
jgi:hypothetical protein